MDKLSKHRRVEYVKIFNKQIKQLYSVLLLCMIHGCRKNRGYLEIHDAKSSKKHILINEVLSVAKNIKPDKVSGIATIVSFVSVQLRNMPCKSQIFRIINQSTQHWHFIPQTNNLKVNISSDWKKYKLVETTKCWKLRMKSWVGLKTEMHV